MLVFPQTFNYRLIIGTLVIAIAVLGSYSIFSYNSFKNQEEFLGQEIMLVQNELLEMISLYDDVSVENESVKQQLEESKTKIKEVLGSLTKTKANLSLISKYRSQVHSLKNERESIFSQIDSLVRDNKLLNTKVDSVSKQFENQKIQLASLATKNKHLLKVVNEIGVLKAKNIKVSALKTSRSLQVFETSKFSEVEHFEVCTTLASNEFTPKGNKNIYVQILDADNKMVSQRGILKDYGESIEYSGKTTIKNVSENTTACLKIGINEKEKLKAGTFYINVFQNATLLGSSTITLK